MGTTQLSLNAAVAMFAYVADGMVDSKDLLTQADKAVGDGDHGVGMARGFAAVRAKLAEQSFTDIGQLLTSIGVSLMTSIGGASGAVFGTFFRAGAKHLGGWDEFTSQALSLLLADGLDAVKTRGGARPGDKTMVDALEPAAYAATSHGSANLDESLAAVTEAARLGMESTKEMIAQIGKARPLGERSLGHPDPGAISTFLIFRYMHAYVTALEDRV
jgi:dihydroxyacetone kinase-like protein